MTIYDLPNGGKNLRVYTYDPPGTPFYTAGGNLYNTGHFDLCLVNGPCSLSDPKGFNDWNAMSAYVQSRGEWGLALVTRADLNLLCAIPQKGPGTMYNASCGGASAISGSIPSAAITNTGSTVQGNLTASVIPTSPTSSAVAAAISPQITPGTAGAVPSGPSIPTGSGGASGVTGLYRFILHDPSNPAGAWSTGANYPGCSQVNSASCDAQAFNSQQDAIDYALSKGEIPYLVNSAGEVWGILAGTIAIDPHRVLGQPGFGNIGMLVAAALALWFLSGR
jgi:hypothetical protein